MPFLAANLVSVLVLVAIYAFLYVVVKSMRSYLAAPAPGREVRAPSPPAPAAAALFVVDESGDERRHSLDTDLVIGRGAGCDISLTDDFASDRHAQIGVDGDGPWVEDLGSTNGTTVGGARIEGRVQIARGATIVVGRTKMVVR